MGTVTLGEFGEPQRDAVIELWRRCGLLRSWNDPNLDIDRKLAIGDSMFLVAVFEHDVVGSVMAGYDGHRGWVNYRAVDPDLHGRGIGRLLMDRAEQRLREVGCPKINLQVRSHNQEVVDFYKSLGYSVEDHVSMGKQLSID